MKYFYSFLKQFSFQFCLSILQILKIYDFFFFFFPTGEGIFSKLMHCSKSVAGISSSIIFERRYDEDDIILDHTGRRVLCTSTLYLEYSFNRISFNMILVLVKRITICARNQMIILSITFAYCIGIIYQTGIRSRLIWNGAKDFDSYDFECLWLCVIFFFFSYFEN